MAASLSSCIPPPRREYSVFFNFRGLDTRESFISHLRVQLEQNGFHTFRDDKNLDAGQSIGPGLLEAIENSSMSLVVFTENYFTSIWCLCELEKIMECRKNSQHFVLPIFYKVEPSDIRHLKGRVAETLAKTLAKYKVKVPKMETWRATLTEAANLSGIVSNQYRDEASLVKDIVKEVQRKLNLCIDLNVATHPVGIEPRSRNLLEKLCLKSSDDVRIIAIWGVGGLGKTTIAKAAFNHIRSRFEAYSFVANVREMWEQSRVVDLQNQIRFDISKNKTWKIRNSDEGVEFLKSRVFYGKKVLLVLDDVNRVEQLNKLAINPESFHRGSRIIVTTRDKSSLNSFHSVERTGHQMGVKLVLIIHELEQLNKDESLRLFSLYAFNQHYPPEGFMEFSDKVVDYAGGIPLVLEVLGCYLNDKNDQSVWESAIEKLEKVPCMDVQGKLKISYDSLDTYQQTLFLDIAFFFVGESRDFTIQVLRDYFPEDGFQRLVDLCLLKCYQGLGIVMHDVIKQMGMEIVRQGNVDCPGKRSRLLDYEDACRVLENCEGTEAVEGLVLFHKGKDIIKVKAKAFQQMTRLRVLHLDGVLLSLGNKPLFRNSGYKDLFGNLVWLRWHHCGLNVLPSELCLENLVDLDLSHSNIKRLWRGTKVLSKLKFLNLSGCHNLITTPNFSELPNLEKLNLSKCVRLQEVDKSIGHLHKLVVLDLSYCKGLRKLPSEMAIKQDWRVTKVLSKLKVLDLSNCPFLTTTPNFSQLPNLEKLFLGNCFRLQKVDESIGHLHKLLFLDLTNCDSLSKLPSEMANLKSLEKLRTFWLSGQCQTSIKKGTGLLQLPINFGVGLRCLKILVIQHCSLTELPDEIGSMISLTQLWIFASKFGCLPQSICNLAKLENLAILYCNMTNLPIEIGRLNQLVILDLTGNKFCSLPNSIRGLTNLRFLFLDHCERLQSLPQLSDIHCSDRVVAVSNCPSLESIPLKSIMNYQLLSCYNCPKLYRKYSADNIGKCFLNYKGVFSFGIGHSVGLFPDWLQHETTNSYYALKVPPFGVGNKHFIRCILYAVHTIENLDNRIWYMDYKLHNKTKDVHQCSSYRISWGATGTLIGDNIIFHYTSFHVDELDLKEGDEIEIFWTYENVVLKKWGIHISCYTTDDHHQ